MRASLLCASMIGTYARLFVCQTHVRVHWQGQRLRTDNELTMALQVMGINVQPLLAVGGVSGIAIGFGAQSVSANAITGINLVSLALPAFL